MEFHWPVFPTALVTLWNRATCLDFGIFLNPIPSVRNIKVTESPPFFPKRTSCDPQEPGLWHLLCPALHTRRWKWKIPDDETLALHIPRAQIPFPAWLSQTPELFQAAQQVEVEKQRGKGSFLLGKRDPEYGTHWSQCSQGRESYLGLLLFRISP